MAYKLNDEQETLRGGISYYTYIWRTEPGACEACQALDGTEYTSTDEIPDKVHPNCKCYIDVVNEQDNYNNPQDDENNKNERCDCLDDLWDDIDEIIGSGLSLQDEIQAAISDFEDKKGNKYLNKIKDFIDNVVDNLRQIFGTVGDFVQNYQDMKEANTIGADKYFHSKANCDGTQRGELGAAVAKGISDLREYTDSFKNICIKGMTKIESEENSKEDQEANEYGRQQGRDNPYNDCGDLVNKYRPNGLDDRY